MGTPDCVITDPQGVKPRTGSRYPAPFAEVCMPRIKRALGDAVGLTNFGVNLTELPPGTWSSQRHWHAKQDEFVYVVEGEITLVTDEGETLLKQGMCAGFPAGKPNGHCLINRSDKKAVYLEIGDRTPGDSAAYSDIDMAAGATATGYAFTHRDGTPY